MSGSSFFSEENLIRHSSLQYKFALGIHHQSSHGKDGVPTMYPNSWSWGKHVFSHSQLEVKKEDQEHAAMFLVHSTLLTIVTQIDAVFGKAIPNRFESDDGELKNSAIISRMIRNAYAHNPFFPVWKIQPDWRNKIYEVVNVISVDTTDLHGKALNRSDYGGPLAILMLAEKAIGYLGQSNAGEFR